MDALVVKYFHLSIVFLKFVETDEKFTSLTQYMTAHSPYLIHTFQ